MCMRMSAARPKTLASAWHQIWIKLLSFAVMFTVDRKWATFSKPLAFFTQHRINSSYTWRDIKSLAPLIMVNCLRGFDSRAQYSECGYGGNSPIINLHNLHCYNAGTQINNMNNVGIPFACTLWPYTYLCAAVLPTPKQIYSLTKWKL